jgi:hypothetical protein
MSLKFISKNNADTLQGEAFQTVSYTVPSTLVPEVAKTVAKMIVSHYKPTAPQPPPTKEWEIADIPAFFTAIPEDGHTMIAHLHAYNNGLLKSTGRGLSAEMLAEVLGTGWSENKVNGMLSPIQRAASEMGRGPVIFRNGITLYLTQDFYKALSVYYENIKNSKS